MLDGLTDLVRGGGELARDQVAAVVGALVREDVGADEKADFLWALATRGETPAELGAFAAELRALAVRPELDASTRSGEILDVVGTGGDRLNTFNISTTVAIVASSAGVVVAKHGNRAITSKSGSADVLSALGVKVELAPAEAGRWLRDHGFAFFFAPAYHPAFRHVAPARKLCAERGQRTLFNLLGPLLNPAGPTCQLMGVPRPNWCGPMALALQSLGVRRAMVVSGQVPESRGGPEGGGWLDELSTLGPTSVAEYHHQRGFHESELEPTMFPVQPSRLSDLAGGDREANAAMIRRLLNGEDHGPRLDAVLLNAGAALMVAGATRSIADGWGLAEEAVSSGRAAAKLRELVAASS